MSLKIHKLYADQSCRVHRTQVRFIVRSAPSRRAASNLCLSPVQMECATHNTTAPRQASSRIGTGAVKQHHPEEPVVAQTTKAAQGGTQKGEQVRG